MRTRRDAETAVVDDPFGNFSDEDVDRSSRYRRPIRFARMAQTTIILLVLALACFTPIGRALGPAPSTSYNGAWTYGILLGFLIWLLTLPLTIWMGYAHRKAWGLELRPLRKWLIVPIAGCAAWSIGCGYLAWTLLGLEGTEQGDWVLSISVWLLLGFVVGSLLIPPFVTRVSRRIQPLTRPDLDEILKRRASHAGVRVHRFWVISAARRTTQANAAVLGWGPGRRIILFDTLLDLPPSEIDAAVAHELGHVKRGHVPARIGIVWARVSICLAAVLLALDWGRLVSAAGGSVSWDATLAPLVLLVAYTAFLLTRPLTLFLYRAVERSADRFALTNTRDPVSFAGLFRSLARSNLLEIDPPSLVRVWTLTHPSPRERITEAKAFASEGQTVAQ